MLQLYEYELPFKSPFRTGSSVYKSRCGILLHFRENEIDLVTEASPLPGFSEESYAEVKEILIRQKDRIHRFLEQDFSVDAIRKLERDKYLNLPSLQFAVSFLALAIKAEREEKTISETLQTKMAGEIEVNDIIPHGIPNEIESRIGHSIREGFRTLKIKAPHPSAELASLLSAVQKKYPDIQFRLDANRSWPVSSLKKHSALFRNLPIQYVEEPIHIKKTTEIPQIQSNCLLPIALDETVHNFSTLKKILIRFPEIYIIIKPMLLGNILKIHETISQFRSSCKYIVVTTSLESMVGRSMTATVASLIGDPNLSHGLHTGHLFEHDLLPDFEIKDGSIRNHSEKPGFRHIKASSIKKLG